MRTGSEIEFWTINLNRVLLQVSMKLMFMFEIKYKKCPFIAPDYTMGHISTLSKRVQENHHGPSYNNFCCKIGLACPQLFNTAYF